MSFKGKLLILVVIIVDINLYIKVVIRHLTRKILSNPKFLMFRYLHLKHSQKRTATTTAFFDFRGIVHQEFFPTDWTVNIERENFYVLKRMWPGFYRLRHKNPGGTFIKTIKRRLLSVSFWFEVLSPN